MAKLTQLRLREVLSYDRATGVFTWKVTSSNRAQAGSVAGSKAKWRYVEIRIDGELYLAHRLAWFYVRGRWPRADIDHRDTNKANNAFDNLRNASTTMNNQNIRKATVRSSTGLLGVVPNGLGFSAQISVGNKSKCLGTYDTPEKAHARYLEEKRRVHRGNTL